MLTNEFSSGDFWRRYSRKVASTSWRYDWESQALTGFALIRGTRPRSASPDGSRRWRSRTRRTTSTSGRSRSTTWRSRTSRSRGRRAWAAKKKLEISKSNFKFPRARNIEIIRYYRQTLQGSFSAVSKPNFASKHLLESSRRDLHNALLCTVL